MEPECADCSKRTALTDLPPIGDSMSVGDLLEEDRPGLRQGLRLHSSRSRSVRRTPEHWVTVKTGLYRQSRSRFAHPRPHRARRAGTLISSPCLRYENRRPSMRASAVSSMRAPFRSMPNILVGRLRAADFDGYSKNRISPQCGRASAMIASWQVARIVMPCSLATDAIASRTSRRCSAPSESASSSRISTRPRG